MARPKKYPDELIQRGIRLALESDRPIAHIAHDLGMHPETLRKKVCQHEADSGKRPEVPTSAERGAGGYRFRSHARPSRQCADRARPSESAATRRPV
jgi:transposase-like protein